MDKINWKQKLSSRKFWAMAAAFAASVMAAIGTDNGSAENITSIITAAGVAIAYIFGESYVDSRRPPS